MGSSLACFPELVTLAVGNDITGRRTHRQAQFPEELETPVKGPLYGADVTKNSTLDGG